MFILIVDYLKPLNEVETYLPAHRAYLEKYYDQGLFICSGRQIPRTGGVILCRKTSREIIEKIIREDPFLTYGIATYKIIALEPTGYAPGFESFL